MKIFYYTYLAFTITIEIGVGIFLIAVLLSGCTTIKHKTKQYDYGMGPIYQTDIYNPYENFDKIKKYPILGAESYPY